MTTFEIDNECIEPKRDIYTTLEETYMAIALAAKLNSKDPSTQVGVCYVAENGRVLSVGCNQVPNGWDEDKFPWGTKPEYSFKNNKYTYIIHAEMAGMTSSYASVNDFHNSTIYTTLFPCTNCAKLIASLGVKRVVYLHARTNCDDYVSSRILLNNANVECVDFKELTGNQLEGIDIDFNENEKNVTRIRKRSIA